MCSVGNNLFRRAFTLVELLVTVALIAAFMAILLPAVKGLKGGSLSLSATTQLMADLHNARHMAIKSGSPVYVVFFPKWKQFTAANIGTPLELLIVNYMTNVPTANRLLASQLTAYAFYATAALGDQPGQESRHFVSDWKLLPEGSHMPATLFDLSEGRMPWARFPFLDNETQNNPDFKETDLLLKWPTKPAPGLCLWLPYIGFDGKGRLVGMDSKLLTETTLTVAEGGVLPPPLDANGMYEMKDTDEKETTIGSSTHNRLKISSLTGRLDRRAIDKYDLMLLSGPDISNVGGQNQARSYFVARFSKDPEVANGIVNSVANGTPAILLRDRPLAEVELGKVDVERQRQSNPALNFRTRID